MQCYGGGGAGGGGGVVIVVVPIVEGKVLDAKATRYLNMNRMVAVGWLVVSFSSTMVPDA